MELQKVLRSKVKVRFNDCDPFNHLNNSKYIDYIVNERSEQLIEHYDLDTYVLASRDRLGWVTAQTTISYLAPAFPNEEVVIETRLMRYSDKSLDVEGVMLDSKGQKVKAVLWIRLVHFNLQTQKSHPHSEELLSLFAKVVHPFPSDAEIGQRVSELRGIKASVE